MSRLGKQGDEARRTIALVAVGFVAYAIVASLVLLPRFVIPRARRPVSDSEVAFMRWSFASAPFPITAALVAAGAQQWVLSVGLLASVALLVVATRAVRRDGAAG